jgi:trans-aconitate 2-methyltransferase
MADWDGAEYRRVNSLQQWLADRALRDLTLDEVSSVLDVGCGDGRITAEISARVPAGRVVGIDPSPRMISIAPAGGRLRFEVGDVIGMTYAREFDLVVSFNALHWVLDQRAALDRIGAALLPGGRALLVFVCAGARPSLESVAMEVAATPRWAGSFAGFSAPFVHPVVADWCALAVSTGLNVAATAVDDLAWDFGSRDAFARWCAVGFGAWTARLTDAAAGQFVDDVVSAYEPVAGGAGQFRFMQLRAELQI